MDKEFEDKGHDGLEDLNNIIFTDAADEAGVAEEQADEGAESGEKPAAQPSDGACEVSEDTEDYFINSPAPTAAYNTSGGASAQPGSARGPENTQAAGSAAPASPGAPTNENSAPGWNTQGPAQAAGSARGPESDPAAAKADPNTYTFHRPAYNNAAPGQGAPVYTAKPPKKKKWKIIAIIAIIAAVILAVSACAASMITGDSGMDANYGGGQSYIGVLHVEGTITTSSSSSDTYQQSWLLKQIDYMMDDSSNEGIMLYVNSPGGSVYASDELYLKLKEYKEETERPVYSYFAETAASGGYYIAAGSDKITANRNCTTGSIGVYLGPILDASGLLDKVGVKVDIVKSGANKAMGNSYQPLTEEQRAIYQEYVNESYEQFVDIVAEGRSMDTATVKQIADGRVYTAKQAKANGLIDEISSFEDAKDAMLNENKLEDCTFQNVTYTPKNDIYSLLSQKADTKTDSASAEIGMAQDILNGDYTPELMYMMQ